MNLFKCASGRRWCACHKHARRLTSPGHRLSARFSITRRGARRELPLGPSRLQGTWARNMATGMLACRWNAHPLNGVPRKAASSRPANIVRIRRMGIDPDLHPPSR